MKNSTTCLPSLDAEISEIPLSRNGTKDLGAEISMTVSCEVDADAQIG